MGLKSIKMEKMMELMNHEFLMYILNYLFDNDKTISKDILSKRN